MDHGWIKLHRKLLDWEWYQDLPTKVLFLHLILTVNYEDKKWRGQTIKPGEIITSLAHLSEQTTLSVQSLRTALDKLESTGEVTRTSTNRFTKITLIKWDQYQTKEEEPTSKATNKQQSNNKQTTTTKELKKERKEEKHTASPSDEDGKEVNEILGLFKAKLNPTINFGNTTNRKAVKDLLKKFGKEKLISTIDYIDSIREDRYAPNITTPWQLLEKMGQLINYHARNNSKKNNIAVISDDPL